MDTHRNSMNGAESIVETLAAGGVDTCFTNPGTSEMHLVAALDRQTQIRSVLGLFEGVVTAAADGYARMAGKPACTLLHLGPGLANGLANLHNARRAHVPLVNIVGQHAIFHLQNDSPLNSDIEGIARPWSGWTRTSRSAAQAGRDTAEAVAASKSEGGQIATLIVPADIAWSAGGVTGQPISPNSSSPPSEEKINQAAALLHSGKKTALILSGNALFGKGLALAGRIAANTKATLIAPYPFARMERGCGRPEVLRLPYPREQAFALLSEFPQVILVGAQMPVAYFASPQSNASLISSDAKVFQLALPNEDPQKALDALAASLRLPEQTVGLVKEPPKEADGPITLQGLATVVAATLPENAIVVDESMTSGRGMLAAAMSAPPHDWLANTGGSIGIALPLAVGAAVACPSRNVLCLSADGSSMYTLQALWTMAREGLKITTVIFANRVYSVLQREFSSLGIGDPGPIARSLFEIDRPAIDWVSLAKGMGVPASRVHSLDEFGAALREGYASEGPALIEVPL
jgi:acetolactate synthase I/II/III large subunit